MIHLDFPSSTIQKVFSYVEEYKSNGKYPEIEENDFFEIIPLVLELQIDSLIKHLAPLIGQNIKKMSDRLINMIPSEIEPLIIDNIPISVLDPDFFLEHFDVNELIRKMEVSYIWNTPPLNPFTSVFEYKEHDPVCRLANTFANLSFDRFGDSKFVKENATSLWTKSAVNLQGFKQLRSLKIYEADDIDYFWYSLTPTLVRLDINQCKLKDYHLQQLFSWLPNSNIVFLSLRDSRIGQKGCALLNDYLRKHLDTSLQYIDIGLNSIGGDEISRFLDIVSYSTLKGVCVDGNFFVPSSNELGNLQKLRMPTLSLRSLHWDDATVVVINQVLQQDFIDWIDLSAQVTHQNSDPDLSGSMAELLFNNSSESITKLIFANHRLDHIDFNVFVRLHNLRYLCLANSTLDPGEIDTLCPLIANLETLDLSYNNLNFRTNNFLTCCAQSKSLRELNLTNNNLISKNFTFFDELKENRSQIKKLYIANCGLKQKQSLSFVQLIASGAMDLEELDVSSNDLFHVKHNVNSDTKTHIKRLNIGGNQPKFEALQEFLSHVEGIKYIDIDYVPFSIASKIAYLLKGVCVIRISYLSGSKLDDIIKLVKDSQCHALWTVNSMSGRLFQKLMLHWAEMPSLLYMHVEEGMKPLQTSKIPLLFEDRK